MDPTPDMSGVLIKRGKFGHGDTGIIPCEGKTEAGVMCAQANESQDGRSPPPLGGGVQGLQQEPLPTTSYQTSSPRTDRE